MFLSNTLEGSEKISIYHSRVLLLLIILLNTKLSSKIARILHPSAMSCRNSLARQG